jgi:hypothetical protein
LIFNRLNDDEESETSAVKKCAKCSKGWSFWETFWFDNFFFLQWTLNLFSINQGRENSNVQSLITCWKQMRLSKTHTFLQPRKCADIDCSV